MLVPMYAAILHLKDRRIINWETESFLHKNWKLIILERRWDVGFFIDQT